MPGGARFFQCCTKPCARLPAVMIATKETVARPAVMLKLPVAVAPPCNSRCRNESGPE